MNGKFVYTLMTLFVLTVISSPAPAFPQKSPHKTRPRLYAATERPTQNLTTSSFIKKYEPRWEVRTAPIAFIASWTTLDISYRVNGQWALGPSAILYGCATATMFFGPCYKGNAFGFNGNYYFKSAFTNSPYLSTHAYKETYSQRLHSSALAHDRDGYRANLVYGYQWKGRSTSFMLGAGSEYRNHKIKEFAETSLVTARTDEFNENSFLLHVEAKVGLEF